jgi:hypothetical protein
VSAAGGEEGDEVSFWQRWPQIRPVRRRGVPPGRLQLAVQVLQADPLDITAGRVLQRRDRWRGIGATPLHQP